MALSRKPDEIKSTLSLKTLHNYFCQNFVKLLPTLIIFAVKMAKRIKLCEMRLFFTSARANALPLLDSKNIVFLN